MNFFVFSIVGISLIFTSCTNKSESADREIVEKVNKLYKIYGESNEAIYAQPIQEDLFSPNLEATLTKVIAISKDDIEKVKKSDHPDEKPLILEGAIFSSLYEGYSSYKISSVTRAKNTVNVSVNFENDKAIPNMKWTDTVNFINIENQWRIDNIIFDKAMGTSKNLKNSLKTFISYGEQNK